MALVRRRYYFWLVRAYLKRWHKAILSSVILGGIIFFAIFALVNFYLLPRLQKKVQKIGYVGVYTINNIPEDIFRDVSFGLTKKDSRGQIRPGAAYKWEVKNGGREYVFYIKHGQYFHNKKELTALTLPVSFKDLEKKIIDDYTVSFTLKSAYAPLLTTLSKPILLKDLSGLGKSKIKKVDINGGFVRSITLEDTQDASKKQIINFYPTESSLIDAYALGDIDQARGATSTTIKDTDFKKWGNTEVADGVNHKVLVTLFYNTEDKFLSEKKLRQALSYAVPSSFEEGSRAYSPIPPSSIFFSQSPNYGISDLELSESLISDNTEAKKSTFEITTSEEYAKVAEKVSASWRKIGIKSKVKVVTELPQTFQILIYPITLPDDPDQYTLWHSNQFNNITKYKNLRIDKLLEDGRSITDQEQRIAIYSDFQKYLIDDAPATFLYFPKSYTIKRR